MTNLTFCDVTSEILDVFVFSNKSTDTVVFWLFRKNKSFLRLKIKTLNKICQQLVHSCVSAAFPKHWALVFFHLVSIIVALQEFDLTILYIYFMLQKHLGPHL